VHHCGKVKVIENVVCFLFIHLSYKNSKKNKEMIKKTFLQVFEQMQCLSGFKL